MNKSNKIISVLALFFSTFSIAETLYFPEELVPLQVDERKIAGSLFSRVDKIELAPGSYKLKLKYTDLYNLSYDNHKIIESEPFWVSVTVAPGEDYALVFNRANNVVAAKAFASAPQVSLKAKGSTLAKPLNIIAVRQVQHAQFNPHKTEVSGDLPKATRPNTAVNDEGVPSAAAMLNFWWQQATPAEQQAFLDKVTK